MIKKLNNNFIYYFIMENFERYLKQQSFQLDIDNEIHTTNKINPEKFYRILDALKTNHKLVVESTDIIGKSDQFKWEISVDAGSQEITLDHILNRKFDSIPDDQFNVYRMVKHSKDILDTLPELKLTKIRPPQLELIKFSKDQPLIKAHWHLEKSFIFMSQDGNCFSLRQMLKGDNREQLLANPYQYQFLLAIESEHNLSDLYYFLQLLHDDKFSINELLISFRIYSQIFNLYSKNDYMANLINKKINHIDSSYQERLEQATSPDNIERMPTFSKVHTVIMEPVSDIGRTDLLNIFCDKSHYCITDKADGSRSVLYVNPDGQLYFTGFGNLTDLHLKSPRYYSCLFDGELVNTSIGQMYLIFDCLFWNNESLLNFPLLDLKKHGIRYRYDTEDLEELCDQLNSLSGPQLIFSFKNYHYHTDCIKQQKLCETVYQKEYPYNLDGLIFTNWTLSVVEMIQNRSMACFRWKPIEYLSIDVLIAFERNPNFPIELAIYGKGDNRNVKCNLYGRNDNEFHKLDHIATIELPLIHKESYPLTREGDPIFDQTVAEFVRANTKGIDGEECELTWLPIRSREGKTILELYDRTSKIKNITEMTVEPISEEELYKYPCDPSECSIKKTVEHSGKHVSYFLDNPYKNFIRRHYLLDVVNFNNLIKFNIIHRQLFYRGKEYLPNYLDLACGRGNDLYIWNNNVAFYLGIDLDQDNIDACKRVLCPRFKLGRKYRFEVGNLTNPNLLKNIQTTFGNPKTKFNIISIQFALHYITGSTDQVENLLKVCSQLLHRSGYLIITGLDGKAVHQLLQKTREIAYFSDQGDLLWKIEKGYPATQEFGKTGQEIYFTMQSLMGLKPSREFLINFEYLKERLNKHKFNLVDSQLFSQIIDDQEQYKSFSQTLLKHCSFPRYTNINYDELRQTILSNPYLYDLTKLYRYCIFRLN